MPISLNRIKKFLFQLFFLSFSFFSFAQQGERTKAPFHFGGGVTITNNGISLIPNLTLGKPAVLFDLAAGKGKLSFEPQFRFALSGKPWTFIFWWRYKLIKTDKFQIGIGAHPAFLFRNKTYLIDSIPNDLIVVQRYLAAEVSPSYNISKNTSIGFYYLFAHGLEKDGVQFTNFIAVRASLSNIKLTEKYFLKFNPQFYYLKMDINDGFYFTSSLSLARRNFPLAVSSTFSKSISTNIPSGKSLVWNVSLVYSFNKEYTGK